MKSLAPLARCVVLLGAVTCGLVATQAVRSADAPAESVDRLKRDLQYLSSDELEGRGVGLKGLDLAADYIREQFAAAGLKVDAVNGTPFQPFTLPTGAKQGPVNTLEIVGPEGAKINPTLATDFTTQSFGGAGAFFGEMVFCGYGIEAADKNYNDFEGIDLKGKVAIILRKVPQQGNPRGPFSSGRGGVGPHGELRTKVINAATKGAAAILLVNDPYTGKNDLAQGKQQVLKLAEQVAESAVELEAIPSEEADKAAAGKAKLAESIAKYKAGKGHLPSEPSDDLLKFGYAGSEPIREIPVLHITQKLCNQILKGAINTTLDDLEAKIDQTQKPASQVLAGWNAGGVVSLERTQATVKNVIGVVEGAGPWANETIVVGAHYDHVGRGGNGSLAPGSTEIHNGADDNGSGTVSLLELARRIGARAEKLPRRVVFIAFTAEELGLIGSARYTKEPVFPLENTIAMFNMDMVGRLSENKLTVFGVETAKQFQDELKKHSGEVGVELVMKPEGFGPSDHSSFYAKKIPVLHFFTGLHSDYHRPGDDWEKINFEGANKLVDLTERLIVQTAQREAKPEYV
ncbi:MAG: M20/M25/M40 family metallo-hydrolase, partial [Planctomycetota bacterium]|nr:M20/M25/M40 family metallo-hydrolase [Planctomycetota bacterium]